MEKYLVLTTILSSLTTKITENCLVVTTKHTSKLNCKTVTVITFWFQFTCDWLMHNGKCQNGVHGFWIRIVNKWAKKQKWAKVPTLKEK